MPLVSLNHFHKDIAHTAALLDARGWAESSAGNISVLIADADTTVGTAASAGITHFGYAYPDLGGCTLLITGSGKRMRDIACDPAPHLAMIHVSIDGTCGTEFRTADENFEVRPSSELETHIALHNAIRVAGRSETCIVHAHATEIAAITQISEYKDEDTLNNLIWSMQPEAALFLPRGVGLVPYTRSGTQEIAEATVRALGKRSVVIWEKHGILAVGESCEAAFDLIDVVAKSIRIYLLCKNAGFVPEGLTMEQIETLRRNMAT